jgi:osmotically-inducible protein OsmY
MKNDDNVLHAKVIEAIRWEPLLHENKIDVSVQDGIVSLNGVVENYAQKSEARDALKNILGVRAIVDDLRVEPHLSAFKNDQDIAASVIKVFKENWAVPDHRIMVTVQDGWVTLEGILHWNFQRKAADNAIRYLQGVRGVIDMIKIEAEVKNELRQEIVEKALKRSWLLEVDNIIVRVDGRTIVLSGIVNSLFQKEEAERIAWNTPGVWYVENEILVEFDMHG